MKTINLYSFSELNPNAQQRVIDHARDNDEYMMTQLWRDEEAFQIQQFTQLLENQGLDDALIEYTGFSSQGDGLSFTAEVTDLSLFLQSIGVTGTPLLNDEDLLENLMVYIERAPGSHYCHENTCGIRIYGQENCLDPNAASELSSLIHANGEQWRTGLCRRFYRELEKAYDQSTSDEAIRVWLEGDDAEYWTEAGNPVV
jgi:hypothetical protein